MTTFTIDQSPAPLPDGPFKRSPELLVPAQMQPHGAQFRETADGFMDSDEHHLIDIGHRRGVRLDRYEEDGDLVYSIIHPIHAPGERQAANTLQATSLVAAEDGRLYGEWHWFKQKVSFEERLGSLATPLAGVRHPLRMWEWREQIIPVTRALTDGRWLLKVVS